MGLFWKTGNRRAADVDQVAEKLAFRLLKLQQGLADRINHPLRKVNLPVLVTVLVALGTAFGIYCFYLVLSAFF
ncbi:hypothetical protein SAMN05421820_101475 [Pedobacter steynii]|uniref:Uncharacterized protein n=1 Tax=Pedobacter steynii TaxID=430522 RepID=A0A1G9K5N5_9SPHI|nr:hypothetical protein [Pedobacter steynii]NQX38454.1 hypothetical protein [Pedobacter steynii]SDL44979.1 hypothetical protein SAMN05421820_101475 [Pedobacter steynii]